MGAKIPGEKGTRAASMALLGLVPLVWGYGIVATEEGLANGSGVFPLLFGRFFTAALLLFAAKILLGKRGTPFSARDAWAGGIAGIVNFFGFFFQSIGLLYTDAAKSGLLTGAYVVLVPLACGFGKKFSFRAFFCALLFAAGALILFDVRGRGGFNRGDAFTLVGALFFAGQILLVEFFSGKVDTLNFNAAQMLAMAALGLAGAAGEGNGGGGWQALPYVLYLGVFSSAFAYLAQTYAQSRVSSSFAAVVLGLEAPAGALFGLAFGKAEWTVSLGIGCAVMTAASVLAAAGERGEKKKTNSARKPSSD